MAKRLDRRRGRPRPPKRARKRPRLGALTDEQLLEMRLCDLGVTLEGTEIMRRIKRVYREVAARGIDFRPHIWLSSEWFSPDGVPGIAVPFYLAHERLIRLEQKMMHFAEGAAERLCLKILRHEVAHTICTAWRLHYRKQWRQVFGRFSAPYPDSYRPRPSSRDYVHHFDGWYAQAHPAEDFAETFAVWLRPRNVWRRQYHGWPALRKLEYVDALMQEIAGTRPPVRSHQEIEPLSSLRTTLRQHYRVRHRRYGSDWPDFFDGDLRKIFSEDDRFSQRETAAAFLRRTRPAIREAVSHWTGQHPYTIDQVLRDMIDRCKELNLRLATPQRDAKMQATLMLTVQTMNYIHGRGLGFAL